jgi:hypothetical protein
VSKEQWRNSWEAHLSAVPVLPRDRLQVGPTAGGEVHLGRGRSGLLVTSSPGCTCDGGGIAASKGLSSKTDTRALMQVWHTRLGAVAAKGPADRDVQVVKTPGCSPEQARLVGLVAGVGIRQVPTQDQHICSREHLQIQHGSEQLTQLLSKHTDSID